MIKLAWTAGQKKVLVICLLSVILTVVLNLINLYITPVILSAVERHVPITELLLTIAFFVLCTILVSAASTYVKANTTFSRADIRSELLSMLNKKSAITSYPNLDDEKFKNLLSKAHDCLSSPFAPGEAIWTTLTNLGTNFLGFIIYTALLSSIQPILILAILITASISYFIGNYVNQYGYRHREEEGELHKHMFYLSRRSEDLAAAKDIRIFGMRPWLEDLYRKTLDAYTAFQQKAQSVYIWAKIADLILTFFRNAIAYAYLIHLVVHNDLDVAQFLLYFTAVGGFSGWVIGILGGFNTLYKQSLDISTIRECIEYKEPFKFKNGETLKADPEGKYEIRLENVSFRYPGADKDTLTKINLTLHPGERLAIVGLNGAGKTTLIKLICGFLDPTEGRVLLDGKDIRIFNRYDYYAMFSAVFQTFSLLADTVAVNVAQDYENIDMERVKTCVEKAGLKQKIESLPKGYQTYLNRQVYEDAAQFSGGENQRLMLARALYKNAPFILLDEPTAALDPVAESEMYQKYNEMTGGRSSIYISHRLASTRFCDRIIMLEHAVICEEGTHDELLRRNGRYADLYKVQSKYYKEGDSRHGKE